MESFPVYIPSMKAGQNQTDKTSSPPWFDAVLRPHRSLSPNGFLILMGVLGLVSLLVGTVFLIIGAWPVFGFFGLDVLIVYLAFRANFASAQIAEHIVMDEQELSVTRTETKKTARWSFQPAWVQVGLDTPTRHHSRLWLGSHGKRLTIGAFLAPSERKEVADALKSALNRYRNRTF